jgi:methionine salvage enolase-phosphatase E1
VLDIEGTTTPISFVKDILFPYAEEKVECFLTSTWETPETMKDVECLLKQAELDQKDSTVQQTMPGFKQHPGLDANKETLLKWCVENVKWQISFNRKTGSLKQLQGHIWRAGYECGELKGQV